MLLKKYVMNFYHLLKLTSIKQIWFLKRPSCKGTVTFRKNNSGRITGSNFYKICHIKKSTSPDNILKDLLGYCPLPSEGSQYNLHGDMRKKNQLWTSTAKKLKKVHRELHVVETGLIIDLEFSHLGSSPDIIRVCQCCGKWVVKVKSLYSPLLNFVQY